MPESGRPAKQSDEPQPAAGGGGRNWMAVSAALLLIALASSFGVIFSAHKSRELFRELERSRLEQNEIQIEWRQLLIERSTLSSHVRVEAIARSELQMEPLADDFRVLVIE
jgi:cell division protein FtsL